MIKLPDPDNVLDDFDPDYFKGEGELYGELAFKREEVIKAMKEYGRQIRDITLEWAAFFAEVKMIRIPYAGIRAGDPETAWYPNYIVDKESIIEGKNDKTLEI
jgi:hypothetical protein